MQVKSTDLNIQRCVSEATQSKPGGRVWSMPFKSLCLMVLDDELQEKIPALQKHIMIPWTQRFIQFPPCSVSLNISCSLH